MKRILIIAGGTGGHVFPALAVARALRKEGVDVQWLGSHVGMETELLAGEFPLSYMSIGAIRGKGFLSKLLSPLRICLGTFQALRVIRRLKPHVVLGMGGYVSGPGGLAARLARVPLIIHEQNAVAGFTNRVLSRVAKAVLQGFPNAFSKRVMAETIGNPVRPTISNLAAPNERMQNRSGPLRVLVVGGSQGARAINQSMMRVLSQYQEAKELQVWHQTGKLDFEMVQKAYRTLTVDVTVEPFIANMAEAYSWADLMICRAGALTVSEIAAVGVASILIPFPYAVDDHQFHNGAYLANAGAAEIVRQEELTDARLAQMIHGFARDRDRLKTMAMKARSLAKPDALSAIVITCQKFMPPVKEPSYGSA